MSSSPARAERRQLARDNAKQPLTLREVPRAEWPSTPDRVLRVWRSRDFLVVEYKAPPPAIVRLTVNRTTMAGDRWNDNITWDELQQVKIQAGYNDFDAIEVYPPAKDVVNVANMRHLWVLALGTPLPFAWRRGQVEA